tara:strand:+ start:12 stop:656 length:645 start_codon:yes stop_codon:yes gene_type:complete
MALVDIAKNTNYDIDRTHGTREVIDYIRKNDDSVDEVLDVFAGDGSFCSWLLYRLKSTNELPNVTHLEYNFNRHSKLVDRFGRHRQNCLNVDSYDWMKKTDKKFDLIFCDNGMGDNEYFDIVPLLKDNLNKNSWFVHNINVRPYGMFMSNTSWQQHRSHFYNLKQTWDCDPEDLLNITSDRLKEAGLSVNWGTLIPRELYNGHIYLYHAIWNFK